MKKRIIYAIILSAFLFTNTSAAYIPNRKENLQIQRIKYKIAQINKKQGLQKIIEIKNKINEYIETNRDDERKVFLLRAIKTELVSYIENKKQVQEQVKKTTTIIKQTSNPKQDLLDKYGNKISGEIVNACIKHYDFIDNIAKEQNFPTELIIAMWKKEHNCNLDNPANGWGAFQITSRYYNPGEISLEEFKQEIIDFINFSKNKIAYYNKDSGKFKAIFGKEDIVLNYSNYSARNIRLYALLYNGIRKSTDINTFLFANANLNGDLKSNSDGIFTTFLKVLKWKLK